MDFLRLYGKELDRALGSADRTQLFTTERRQDAINAAQLEWAERTQCTVRQIRVTLTDDVGEYDLDSLSSDVVNLSAQGVTIEIVPTTGSTRYIEGDDLRVLSVEALDQETPGWRAVSAGTPTVQYSRQDGGKWFLGFHPKPSIAAGDTWTALVGVVVIPTTMFAASDEPFTINGNPLRMLRPYHRALVHFAAYDLEQFRKDTARGGVQLQLFESYVTRYEAAMRPKGGQVVRFVRNYRHRSDRRLDPRLAP